MILHKHKTQLLLLFLLPASIFSQKEANHWYFGNKAGLDFSSGIPVAVNNSQIMTNEGCASISDKNTGRLLFYTNGIKVWDSTHTQMPNGSGLWGHSSSTQSGVIVPLPNSSSVYYIFSVDAQADFPFDVADPNYGGVSFSVVDMSLNSGKGDISLKNQPLLTPTDEKVTAVKHCNGIDYWIITHKWNSDSIYAFLLTANGIASNTVVTKIGPVHKIILPSNSNTETLGYLKASPNGKKLAEVSYYNLNTLEIYDFDNSTGIVSNPIIDVFNFTTFSTGLYGLSFSPDNSKLYITYNGISVLLSSAPSILYQYDLNAGSPSAILASRKTIASTPISTSYGALQIGPDNKIYIAKTSSTTIDVIHEPNKPGLLCNYQASAVSISTGSCVFGLPDFIESFFDTHDLFTNKDTVVCGTITLSAGNPGASYLWSTGDTSISITTNLSGTYWVRVDDGCTIKTDTINITNLGPSSNLPDSAEYCTNQYTIDPGNSPGNNYLWSTGETTQSIIIQTPGKYKVTIANNNCSIVDSIQVKQNKNLSLFELPNIFTPNDDNVNDFLEIAVNVPTSSFYLKIFNRWGQLIFETNNKKETWDGKYKGNKSDEGVYFIVLSYESDCSDIGIQKLEKRGTLTLVR